MPTRALALAATLVAVATVAVGVAGSAHASAYRYWTYWQGSTGAWAFATAGPAATVPGDGSVEGWRFAVTSAAGVAADAPRIAASFDELCGGTPVQEDRKRVALVLDFGDTAIAPAGQVPPVATATCVVADLDATGYQVLRAAATVRTDGGLICGIGDYPSGECAPVVDLPAASSTTEPVPSPGPASASPDPATTAMDTAPDSVAAGGAGAPWVTAAVVALVAVVGLVLWRRRHD